MHKNKLIYGSSLTLGRSLSIALTQIAEFTITLALIYESGHLRHQECRRFDCQWRSPQNISFVPKRTSRHRY